MMCFVFCFFHIFVLIISALRFLVCCLILFVDNHRLTLQDAMDLGHVRMGNLDFKVVDMRK